MNSAPAPLARPRDWAALIVLTLAVTLLTVNNTVLALAVPALTEDLQATSTQVLWIGDIYALVIAGLLITAGNLADRIGRKRLLLIGTLAFGLSSALAAFSTTPDMLIAARALLGISGASIMPSTLSLIRGTFLNPGQRTRAIAIWSAGATVGGAIGPLVGGALLERFHWGTVFLINVPIMILVLIFGSIFITESRNPARPRIDLLSTFLSFLAIVPIVYAIKSVVRYGFTLPVVAAFIVGVVTAVIFIRRQRTLERPLIDINLFRVPAFAGSVLAITIAVFSLSGLVFFFSQYLQLVRGFSPLFAGIAELPTTAASLLVVFAVAWLVARLGRGRAMSLGLLLIALGMVALAITEDLPAYVWLALSIAVIGAGVSITATIANDTVVSVVPKERAGAAASVNETGLELGTALGIAVLGSVLSGLYSRFVTVPDEFSDQSAAITESLATAAQVLRDAPEALAIAQHAFTDAMQITALIAAGLTLLASVLAFIVIPSTKGPLDEVRDVEH